LCRLQGEVLRRGIEIRRNHISDIQDVFKMFPSAKAIFNCTGLGSYHLKGIEDKSLYPQRVSYH
jgi:D-amino-acid oxidase